MTNELDPVGIASKCRAILALLAAALATAGACSSTSTNVSSGGSGGAGGSAGVSTGGLAGSSVTGGTGGGNTGGTGGGKDATPDADLDDADAAGDTTEAGGTNSKSLVTSLANYAAVADNSMLSITGDFTIEAWVKAASAVGVADERVFVAKYDTETNQRSFSVSQGVPSAGTYAGQHVLRLYVSSTGASASWADAPFNLGVATWHHVAVVYDSAAGSAVFYVDGTSVGGSGGLPTSVFDGMAPFTVGQLLTTPSQPRYWDGSIDEVRLWNVKRTAAEIAASQSQQLGASPGLVGYWPLDGSYVDATGNGNDMAPVGGPSFASDVPF